MNFSSLNLLILYVIFPHTFAMCSSGLPTQEKSDQQDRKIIAHLIDEHIDEIATHVLATLECHEFPWLPGYYIKSNYFNRIEGAQALTQGIVQHDLTLLVVPEKWLHPIARDHCPARFAQEGVVVAKKIEGKHQQTMTLPQAKQVCALLKYAKLNGNHYSDTHDANLIFCTDGRVAFIDTEAKSFYDPSPLSGLKGLLDWHIVENQAQDFIKEQIEYIEKSAP